MIKGIYAAFSALQSAWQFQDVVANNISNANTVGYKRETVLHQAFRDVLLSYSSGSPIAPFASRGKDVLGQIGTGMFVAGLGTDFAPGELTLSANHLDFALERGFFAIQSPDGQVFYTRDGRFNRDANGDLITSHGYHVLDVNGQPVNVPTEDVKVGADGTITNDGDLVGQIATLVFGAGELTRAGESYFASAATGRQINGQLHQGFLEGSNTQLTDELTSMMSAQRTFQANQTILARLDETLNQAAGDLGQLRRE